MSEPTQEAMLATFRRFCDPDAYAMLAEPFVKDGYLYACNGRIGIRAPHTGPDTVFDDRLSQSRVNGVAAVIAAPPGTYEPFPPLGTLIEATCKECSGTGRASAPCSECNGTGQHLCDCGHEHYCMYCDDGFVRSPDEKCAKCNGSGKQTVAPDQIVGGRKVAGCYLELIHSLGDPRYLAEGPSDKPLHFTASEGIDGAVCPIIPGI